MSNETFVFECNLTEPPFNYEPMFMRVWLCSKDANHGGFDFTLLSEKPEKCGGCEPKFLWEKEFQKGFPDPSKVQLMILCNILARGLNSVSEFFEIAGEETARKYFDALTTRLDAVMSSDIEGPTVH